MRRLHSFFVFSAIAAVGGLIACSSDLSVASLDAAIPSGAVDAGLDAPITISDRDASVPAFTVGGNVTGLTGTGLVLQNEGGDDLAIAADGSFAFPAYVPAGSAFAITVKTQPSTPAQTCTVSGGAGTVAQGNVTSVTVNCAANTYTIGGTASGVVGAGLVLQDMGRDDLVVNANGTFAFATTATDGASYAVTVKSQPTSPSQVCSLTSDSGKVAAANVTGIGVVCVTSTFDVGGTVAGLQGTGLVLKDNAGDDLAVSAKGTFKFPAKVASGQKYAVTIAKQPTSPSQTCTVSGESGTIGAGAVSSVVVSCKTDAFAVGGTSTNVLGTGLVLQDNGADDLSVTASGTFAFATPIDNGKPYAVTLKTQPTGPSQTCTLTNASGTMGVASVKDVGLFCTTNRYTIKGKVTGLAGTGLKLQNNTGDDVAVTADGDFAFATTIESGKTYAVTVSTPPTGPSQSCSVAAGTGTVGAADVADVVVSCVTKSFTVGGAVSGLVGTGLFLRDNGGDDLAVAADGGFTFGAVVLSGKPYAVTVQTQPATPTQTCLVSAGAGTVTNGNVATVAINCSTNKYTVGGSVTGLNGTGLVLQNESNADLLTVNANGNFALGTAVASGQAYKVSVKTQPTNPSQTCVVTAGAATVGGGNVTGIAVGCTTNTFAVGGSVTGLVGTVVLKNNGADALTLNADGSFVFPTPIASGAAYEVTVGTRPNEQFCSVTNGSGTVAASSVSTVTVKCGKGVLHGPSHTFAGLTSTHFITQGGCSPTNATATDAAYFCQHFYVDTACIAQSYTAGSTTASTDTKMHNRNGCTSQGTDIPGTSCSGGACKIGNWNESTSGINNIVCLCSN